MLTPEYLNAVPDTLLDLYAEVEADILADMARRINGYDYFIPSAQHQLDMLEEMGGVREDIISKLQKLTGKSAKEMERIMVEAGMESLKVDDAIYKAVGLSPAPLAASKHMQDILQAGLDKTNGLFENLTRTTASTATRQFERVLDEAYMKITSGAFSPDAAVKSAIKDLSRQGVQSIHYPSGHTDSMDVAVRRATITGVNQTTGKLQEARADELGCDLVETTAHPGARPSHAEWQGQVFSRSGKSRKYRDFVSVTGYGSGDGLKGWNCSHDFRPYFEGMPLTYSDELLKSYDAKDFEYNGQKMTQYEAQQQQRKIERNIRRWKRENIAMSAAGKDTTESAGKLKQWRDTEKDFLSQTELRQQGSREFVSGFGRSEAVKATHDAKVLNMMKQDAIVKSQSGLPTKLAVADTTLKNTAGVGFPNLSGVVPKGADVTDVRIIAGSGTSATINDWKRLYNLYGGDPREWTKVLGTVATDNYKYEVHWYEMPGLAPANEMKTKGYKAIR